MGEGFRREVLEERVHAAANRLHHLSMRYVGALVEAATGSKVGMLPGGYPGLREMRDLIDLAMLQRAEVNALTKLLVDAKLLTQEQVLGAFAEEYDWLAREKARFLGCEVTDAGLVFKTPEGGAK